MKRFMWNTLELESSKSNLKFCITEEGSTISNQQFLQLLENKSSFRSFYNEFLIELGYEAFFWENKPMMKSNMDAKYECNIINTDFLFGKSPDVQTFRSYFKEDRQVVTFPNLGNDAQLIAPCPVEHNEGYAHIGAFIREAPESQMQEFWQTVGKEMLNHIQNKPLWLSTSGLGVFWLHARVDSYPKYYQTEEYKQIDS